MQVSWSGIPAPTNADGIALYVNAPGTTVNGLSPLKWQWVNKSPGYAQANGAFSSSGSLVCAALAPVQGMLAIGQLAGAICWLVPSQASATLTCNPGKIC